MAEILRYVDTDVVGGLSDGTSWANAYSSLNAWEAAQQTDLDAANNWMHCYLRAANGTQDILATTILGWTTSATDFIRIETAPTDRSCAARYSTTRYRMTISAATAIAVGEDYVQIDGIQFGMTSTAVAATAIYISGITAINNYLQISNCYMRVNVQGAGQTTGLLVNDVDAKVKSWNLIVSKFTIGIQSLLSTTVDIFNSTVYGCSARGLHEAAGALSAKNCAVFKNGVDFHVPGTIAVDHCASVSNEGTNNVAESSGDADWTLDFVDAANGNFMLLPTSNLVEAGLDDPGAGLFAHDIDGTVRSDWDVGANEYFYFSDFAAKALITQKWFELCKS